MNLVKSLMNKKILNMLCLGIVRFPNLKTIYLNDLNVSTFNLGHTYTIASSDHCLVYYGMNIVDKQCYSHAAVYHSQTMIYL